MEKDLKRSFWTGRSQCLSCKQTLRWYELVPLVSYFVQRGQCRRCGALIPSWVISVEILTGLVWMFF
jgi:leader peptidase (prepilin peptidase) / N-methyltransferase